MSNYFADQGARTSGEKKERRLTQNRAGYKANQFFSCIVYKAVYNILYLWAKFWVAYSIEICCQCQYK